MYLRLLACFLNGMGGFLKVLVDYSKIVEGFLKVAERLFRNFLSKRLGTQKFDCEKKSSLTLKSNVMRTFYQNV